MSANVEQIRLLQQKLCFFKWKIRKFEVYWAQQKVSGSKNTVEYAEKNIKAYEAAADTCMKRISELMG